MSSGTFSVETTLPSGQVWSIAENSNGWVYASDDSQILRRDSNGTWAVDSTLPGGMVYTMLAGSSGRMFAGGTGEILRTDITSVFLSKSVAASSDDAQEDSSGTMDLTAEYMSVLDSGAGYEGFRFQNVTIPNGAIITSASIKIAPKNNSYGTSGSLNIN